MPSLMPQAAMACSRRADDAVVPMPRTLAALLAGAVAIAHWKPPSDAGWHGLFAAAHTLFFVVLAVLYARLRGGHTSRDV
jgi:hypothetical protein